MVATRANRQPAFGLYVTDHHAPIAHCNGLLVLTLAGPRICALTRFDNSVLPHFGLPRTLGASWPTAPKRQQRGDESASVAAGHRCTDSRSTRSARCRRGAAGAAYPEGS